MQEESERVAYDTMTKADGLSSGTTATCDEGIDAMGVDAMDEDGDISANPRKRKGKATRWKIPPTALQMLEQVFKVDKFPSVETRKNLAANLKVSPRQVQVWFQNRRAKWRKQQKIMEKNVNLQQGRRSCLDYRLRKYTVHIKATDHSYYNKYNLGRFARHLLEETQTNRTMCLFAYGTYFVRTNVEPHRSGSKYPLISASSIEYIVYYRLRH